MPKWIEWALSISTFIANLMVIGGIGAYLHNRPKKDRFPLTDVLFGQLEPRLGDSITRKQKIRLSFYNKTTTRFYISRIDIYDFGALDHVRNYKNEDILKRKENYSSVYRDVNGSISPIINVCVQPCSPCVIEGYLQLDYDEQLPEQITLAVVTVTKQLFKYNIQTEAQIELI